jgi:hypothetical protein
VPTARDFVPWRFSDAGHSARGWHRHAGVRETCTDPEVGAWMAAIAGFGLNSETFWNSFALPS